MVDPSQSNDSPGKNLKDARERLGLTVASVARDLHLSSTQINALEADDYQHFHGDTYVKGYLRSYARLLGLDPTVIVPRPQTTVDQSTELPEPGESADSSAGRRRPWLGIVLLLIVAGLVYLVYRGNAERRPEVAQQMVPGGAPSSFAAEDSGRLVFSAVGPSWIEVRDGRGRRLLYQTIGPDRHAVIEGQPPFQVFIGNARSVEIEYNGSQYDLTPHIEGMYARFVVQ